jgi:hypothetical protein
MYSRIALVCTCFALLSSTVYAQNNAGVAPASKDDLKFLRASIDSELELLQKKIDELKDLEKRVNALSDAQQSSQQALHQLADIDQDGKYYARLDPSHEPTRVALRDAISAASPTTGTVVLYNKTNSNQNVVVNDTTYVVVANSKRPVSVPYGSFEVRTCNNRLLRWSFTYPQTQSVIDIVDTSAPTYASR